MADPAWDPARPTPSRLPQVVLATFVVAVLPVMVAWQLRSAGVVDGVFGLVVVGSGLSLMLSIAATSYWKRRPDAGDYTFRELMLWGWLRRLFLERRIGNAARLLGRSGSTESGGLSKKRRTEVLERLAASLEASDPYTHGHSRRVARHAEMIANQMGLPRDEVHRIRTAAAIHDVGKIETPTQILHKPGKLTDLEFAVIQEHPVTGARMIESLGDPALTGMVRHHHERLDGTGYPDGLAGDHVPIGARIIAVADTFDAITSIRPYRGSKAHRQALEILEQEAGTQLDPDAVTAFCSQYSRSRYVAAWSLVLTDPQRVLGSAFRGVDPTSVAAAKVMAATAAVGGVVSAAPEAKEWVSGRGAAAQVELASVLTPGADSKMSISTESLAGGSAKASGREGSSKVERKADPDHERKADPDHERKGDRDRDRKGNPKRHRRARDTSESETVSETDDAHAKGHGKPTRSTKPNRSSDKRAKRKPTLTKADGWSFDVRPGTKPNVSQINIGPKHVKKGVKSAAPRPVEPNKHSR